MDTFYDPSAQISSASHLDENLNYITRFFPGTLTRTEQGDIVEIIEVSSPFLSAYAWAYVGVEYNLDTGSVSGDGHLLLSDIPPGIVTDEGREWSSSYVPRISRYVDKDGHIYYEMNLIMKSYTSPFGCRSVLVGTPIPINNTFFYAAPWGFAQIVVNYHNDIRVLSAIASGVDPIGMWGERDRDAFTSLRYSYWDGSSWFLQDLYIERCDSLPYFEGYLYNLDLIFFKVASLIDVGDNYYYVLLAYDFSGALALRGLDLSSPLSPILSPLLLHFPVTMSRNDPFYPLVLSITQKDGKKRVFLGLLFRDNRWDLLSFTYDESNKQSIEVTRTYLPSFLPGVNTANWGNSSHYYEHNSVTKETWLVSLNSFYRYSLRIYPFDSMGSLVVCKILDSYSPETFSYGSDNILGHLGKEVGETVLVQQSYNDYYRYSNTLRISKVPTWREMTTKEISVSTFNTSTILIDLYSQPVLGEYKWRLGTSVDVSIFSNNSLESVLIGTTLFRFISVTVEGVSNVYLDKVRNTWYAILPIDINVSPLSSITISARKRVKYYPLIEAIYPSSNISIKLIKFDLLRVASTNSLSNVNVHSTLYKFVKAAFVIVSQKYRTSIILRRFFTVSLSSPSSSPSSLIHITPSLNGSWISGVSISNLPSASLICAKLKLASVDLLGFSSSISIPLLKASLSSVLISPSSLIHITPSLNGSWISGVSISNESSIFIIGGRLKLVEVTLSLFSFSSFSINTVLASLSSVLISPSSLIHITPSLNGSWISGVSISNLPSASINCVVGRHISSGVDCVASSSISPSAISGFAKFFSSQVINSFCNVLVNRMLFQGFINLQGLLHLPSVEIDCLSNSQVFPNPTLNGAKVFGVFVGKKSSISVVCAKLKLVSVNLIGPSSTISLIVYNPFLSSVFANGLSLSKIGVGVKLNNIVYSSIECSFGSSVKVDSFSSFVWFTPISSANTSLISIEGYLSNTVTFSLVSQWHVMTDYDHEVFLSFLNGAREDVGLPPILKFRGDGKFSQKEDIAHLHSRNEARFNIQAHDSDLFPVGQQTFQERSDIIAVTGAENLAGSSFIQSYITHFPESDYVSLIYSAFEPFTVFIGWWYSPPHKANMLYDWSPVLGFSKAKKVYSQLSLEVSLTSPQSMRGWCTNNFVYLEDVTMDVPLLQNWEATGAFIVSLNYNWTCLPRKQVCASLSLSYDIKLYFTCELLWGCDVVAYLDIPLGFSVDKYIGLFYDDNLLLNTKFISLDYGECSIFSKDLSIEYSDYLVASTSLQLPYDSALPLSSTVQFPYDQYLVASTSLQLPYDSALPLSSTVQLPYDQYLVASTSLQLPYSSSDLLSSTVQLPYESKSKVVCDFYVGYDYTLGLSSVCVLVYSQTESLFFTFESPYFVAVDLQIVFDSIYSLNFVLQVKFVVEYKFLYNVSFVLECVYDSLATNRVSNFGLFVYDLFEMTTVIFNNTDVVCRIVDRDFVFLVDDAVIDMGEDDYYYTFSCKLYDFTVVNSLVELDEINVNFAGEEYVFYYVSSSMSRTSSTSVEVTLKAVGAPALLEQPYSDAVVDFEPLSGISVPLPISSIVNQVLGFDVPWLVVEWELDPVRVVSSGESVIKFLTRLSESVGGVISSSPVGDMSINYKYGYALDTLSILPENKIGHFFSDVSDNLSSSFSWASNSGFNRFLIKEGTTITGDSLSWVPDPDDKFRGEIRVNTSPWRTTYNLVGLYGVTSIESRVDVFEDVEEVVEFKEGTASLSNGIYELKDFTWLTPSLGSLSYERDVRSLVSGVSVNSGYALLKVKYSFRYSSYRVHLFLEGSPLSYFVLDEV